MAKRQGRQVHVKEAYDIELKEGDENEDDRVSMNEQGRIRPHDVRIGKRLVIFGIEKELMEILVTLKCKFQHSKVKMIPRFT